MAGHARRHLLPERSGLSPFELSVLELSVLAVVLGVLGAIAALSYVG